MDNRGITASDRGTSMSTSAEPPAAADMDPAETLGGRLRQARLQANLSLREVARQLGVSASFVSQLENGKSQPSVATLYSLARLLGVSIDRLFDEQDHAAIPAGVDPLTRPAEEHSPAPASEDDATSEEDVTAEEDAEPLHRGKPGFPAVTWGEQSSEPVRYYVSTPDHRSRLVLESGVSWEQLVRKSDELDFIVLTYPPGSSSTMDGRMLRHDDYEYGILLEGELEVTLGFDVFVLHAGEAIGFDSTIPHLFRNPGTTPARGIWVMHHRHQ
jgi:transcriptional regulator with XRE-family HTH domain